MELIILAVLGLWLVWALRACARHKTGCSGNCAHCSGCGQKH